MKIKSAILTDQGRDVLAFSLVEVLVSVGILGFMMIALFSAFGFPRHPTRFVAWRCARRPGRRSAPSLPFLGVRAEKDPARRPV